MRFVPTKHFHHPPYRAELFYAKTGWSGVMNASGFNCVSSPDQPGMKIVDLATAERIAKTWNSGVLEHVEPSLEDHV